MKESHLTDIEADIFLENPNNDKVEDKIVSNSHSFAAFFSPILIFELRGKPEREDAFYLGVVML